MQATTDIANVFFDIPDGFTAATTTAKQRQIVTVSLWVVTGYQAEQRGFSGAVGADNLPVLTGIYLPAQAIENRTIVVRHDAILEDDPRRLGRQGGVGSRFVCFRQRHPFQSLAMGKLGDQRLLEQVRFRSDFR